MAAVCQTRAIELHVLNNILNFDLLHSFVTCKPTFYWPIYSAVILITLENNKLQ